ncbi:MAG: dihydropteroate synthase [bacterium]
MDDILPAAPAVMGIINVTPDSFSDGGRFFCVENALRQAQNMHEYGVDIVDVGGESTRPGAEPVSEQQELDRVIPVIEAIHKEFELKISIDTSKPKVMMESVRAGAMMVNDVQALQQEGAVEMLATLQVPVCLMHMQGKPTNMQNSPRYTQVVENVLSWLKQRFDICVMAGIQGSHILLDPGFGFGKSLQHNLQLFSQLKQFTSYGAGLLVGVSRKSMFDHLLKLDVANRDTISTVAAALAWQAGARIVRVHDVKHACEARDFIRAYSKSGLN